MLVVGTLGLILNLVSFRIAFPHPVPGDGRFFFLCAGLHICASLAYWQYAMAYGADSILYYLDAYRMQRLPFQPGTIGLVQIVQSTKSVIGGSYLDYFLLFQSFGMIGISLLIRSFGEVSEDLNQPLSTTTKAILFLPGLHFWTSAIGKDAPLFMAVSLIIWAMIKLEHRFWAIFIAFLIMYPIRPHIASISLIAFVITMILDRRTKIVFKIPLAAISVIGLALTLRTVQQSFLMPTLDAGSISEFIAAKQEYGMGGTAGAAIVGLPFPLKVASLLFRPFFFDAGSALGIVSSFENIFLLFVFGTILVRIRTVFVLAGRIVYVRYSVVFSIVLIVLLSLVTYNVGLGLRQKYMVMPAVFLLFATLVTYRQAVEAHSTSQDSSLLSDLHQLKGPSV